MGTRKACVLCGGPMSGLTHLLASCSEIIGIREGFLSGVDKHLTTALQGAPEGDCPSVLLSPHLELDQLMGVVEYWAKG